jgi:hypothetical protein
VSSSFRYVSNSLCRDIPYWLEKCNVQASEWYLEEDIRKEEIEELKKQLAPPPVTEEKKTLMKISRRTRHSSYRNRSQMSFKIFTLLTTNWTNRKAEKYEWTDQLHKNWKNET